MLYIRSAIIKINTFVQLTMDVIFTHLIANILTSAKKTPIFV